MAMDKKSMIEKLIRARKAHIARLEGEIRTLEAMAAGDGPGNGKVPVQR